MADLQVIVGYDSVKAANKELLKIGTNAQKSASVFERAFKKAESQSAKALRQVKSEMKVRKQLASQRKREADAASKVAAVAAKEEDRLKNKYDQSYRTMVIYTKELNDLSMARKKDIITTDQQAKEVASLNAQMAAGTGAFANAGRAMTQNKNKMNGSNMAVQQLGYQFGDFAVQVQGGTSAFVAFSQQGAQLAGMLPMVAGPLGLSMKAAVGLSAALGVGIPIFSAVGRLLFEAGDSAEDAEGKIKSMTEVMKGLKDATKEASMELKVLQGGFRDSLEVEGVDKAVELSNKILELEEKIAKVRADQGKLSSKDIANQRRANASAFTLGNKKEALVLQRQEIEQQLEYLLNARSLTEEAEALRVVKISQLDAAADAYDVQVDSQESFEKQLYAQSQALTLLEIEKQFTKDSAEYRAELVSHEANRLQALLKQKKITEAQAQDALYLFEETLNLTDELGRSTKQGQNLADALKDAASAMASLLNTGSLEAKLAGLVAETNAIVNGANSAAASYVASEGVKAAQKRDTAIAAGVDSGFVNKAYSDRMGLINQVGDATTTRDTVRDNARVNSGGGGGSSSDPIEKLRQQIELNSKLVGLSKEEATVLTQVNAIQNSLGEDRNKYSRETIVGLIQQNEAYKEQQRVIEENKSQQDALAKSIASSMGDAFTSIVEGTMSVKDAFKSMAKSIIKQLFDIFVVKKITGFLEKAIGGLFGGGIGSTRPPVRALASANGNVFSGGSQVQAYANGGVVNSPTNFPMSGNKMGLMGEAGPEAIMPLKRGSNGKLGVQMEGGGGGDVIHISQSFNFQANGDETVKKLIAQAAPKIAQMTKSSMLDDRRRGGVTKAAFG